MTNNIRLAVSIGLLSLCYGCSFAPDYKRPEVQMSGNFKEISQDWVVAKHADQMQSGPWW